MEFYDETLTKDVFTSYSTTYQSDYKKYCDVSKVSYDYERNRTEKSQNKSIPYKPEDHETFSKLQKDVHIPFELLLSPKPIVQTDPRVPFQELEEGTEVSKEEVIKNRPRVFMLPAIPLDNIQDQTLRDLICEHTYTTEWGKKEREATANFKQIKPKIDKIETTDTVSLKINVMPPLSEKFTRIGRTWDDNQVRGDPDPTKEFWIKKEKEDPVICGACVDPLKNVLTSDKKEIIRKLISEDKMRYPHELRKCTTYEGYRPMLPMGIPLEKTELPTLHPLLTVSEALSNRTVEEMKELVKIADSSYSFRFIEMKTFSAALSVVFLVKLLGWQRHRHRIIDSLANSPESVRFPTVE